MNEKTALISADELPTDVASGEALLARHQQHKVESKGLPGRREKGDWFSAKKARLLAAFETFCFVITA
jgi:hypothetical protein